MKKLRIVRIIVVGLLLAGAVALVGCSRYNAEHEPRGQGRATDLAGRNLEQSGRGRNNMEGTFGRQRENGESATEALGRRGTGIGNNQESRGQAGRAQGATPAERGPGAPEQSGKSVVAMGSLEDLSGTLTYDGSEWYLDTGKDLMILHFGNSAYVDSTGIDLREGESIEVRGFVSGEEIAVMAARLNDQVFAYRNEDGTPLWAGNGRRDNQIVRSGSGQGRGQGGGEQSGRQGGQGRGYDDGRFEGRGPGSENEQLKGRGRGLDGADQLPWWHEEPIETDSQT